MKTKINKKLKDELVQKLIVSSDLFGEIAGTAFDLKKEPYYILDLCEIINNHITILLKELLKK